MKIKIDVVNLQENQKLINSKIYELLLMFNKYNKMIEKTETICDTETSLYFRELVKNYMEKEIINIKNESDNLNNNLNYIINTYDNVINKIKKRVNGDKK